jgi:hypothetical protein
VARYSIHQVTPQGNPRPSGYERPSGQNTYCIRQGRYRIVYSIQDRHSVVNVVKVGRRKDAPCGGGLNYPLPLPAHTACDRLSMAAELSR